SIQKSCTKRRYTPSQVQDFFLINAEYHINKSQGKQFCGKTSVGASCPAKFQCFLYRKEKYAGYSYSPGCPDDSAETYHLKWSGKNNHGNCQKPALTLRTFFLQDSIGEGKCHSSCQK